MSHVVVGTRFSGWGVCLFIPMINLHVSFSSIDRNCILHGMLDLQVHDLHEIKLDPSVDH